MSSRFFLGLTLGLLLVTGIAQAQGGQPPPAERPREVGAPAEAPPTTGPARNGGAVPAEATTPPTEPATRPAASSAQPADPKAWPNIMYGLGVSGMYNIVPHFMLAAFLEAAKNPNYGVYQPAFGLHFVRRKALMDMTVRVMFGFYDIADGNWLGRGHEFDETDYTEFHDMNFLWADITWTWHTRLAKQFYLAYGAGIGIGWVTGKVYTTPSYGCTRNNYHDATLCSPAGIASQCSPSGCPRSVLVTVNEREKERSVPPVLPAINALIGLRYDFFRHLSARLDTGIFIPGFYYVQFGITAMF